MNTITDLHEAGRTEPTHAVHPKSVRGSRRTNPAFWIVICAVAPYLALKVLWLSGSTIGLGPDSAAEMTSTRFVIGNAATAAMELLAVFFAFALTGPMARRVPAPVVLVLGGGATGFLAPIALGLPFGVVVQALVSGTLSTGGEGDLEPWVFVTVYCGFGLLGIGLAQLFVRYVLDRWHQLWAEPPEAPARWTRVMGLLGMLPFSVSMLWWAVVGPGSTGPRGMAAPEQRMVLLATGALAVGGYLVPLIARRAFSDHPRLAWAIAWAGCCGTACQGMTHVLLARDGRPEPATVAVVLPAIAAAIVYGAAVLRRSRHRPRSAMTPTRGTTSARKGDAARRDLAAS